METKAIAEPNNLNIDPSIQGAERTIIANVMKTLDPNDQENVIYIAPNGSIYANKPALKRAVYFPKNIGGNAYMDKDGRVFAIPISGPKPTNQTSNEFDAPSYQTSVSGQPILAPMAAYNGALNGKSGPYRRVYSAIPPTASSPGSSWETAKIFLPSSHFSANPRQIQENPQHDTATVYEGGWSSSGMAVDGGFQHSPTKDDWALVLNIQGTGYVQPNPGQLRFKAEQQVALKFYVPQDDEVAAVAGPATFTDGTTGSVTMVGSSGGWHMNGTGNVLKRMTSLAEVDSSGKTGDWFTGCSALRGVNWTNCYIGVSSQSNSPWSTGTNASFQKYPNDLGTGKNYVLVDGDNTPNKNPDSADQEVDSIVEYH